MSHAHDHVTAVSRSYVHNEPQSKRNLAQWQGLFEETAWKAPLWFTVPTKERRPPYTLRQCTVLLPQANIESLFCRKTNMYLLQDILSHIQCQSRYIDIFSESANSD